MPGSMAELIPRLRQAPGRRVALRLGLCTLHHRKDRPDTVDAMLHGAKRGFDGAPVPRRRLGERPGDLFRKRGKPARSLLQGPGEVFRLIRFRRHEIRPRSTLSPRDRTSRADAQVRHGIGVLFWKGLTRYCRPAATNRAEAKCGKQVSDF